MSALVDPAFEARVGYHMLQAPVEEEEEEEEEREEEVGGAAQQRQQQQQQQGELFDNLTDEELNYIDMEDLGSMGRGR